MCFMRRRRAIAVLVVIALVLVLLLLLARHRRHLPHRVAADHDRYNGNDDRPRWRAALAALPLPVASPVVLLQPWYTDASPQRRAELQSALRANIHLAAQHRDLLRIVLLIADGDALDEAGVVDGTVVQVVRVPGYAGRANVSEALAYANDALAPGTIVVLANADIVVDATLRLVAAGLAPQTAFFLSRWEYAEHPRRPSMCSPAYAGSHDAAVFATPLPAKLVDAARFPMGAWGYENRLMWEFGRAGLTASNPCLSVRTYHHHRSAIKTRQLDLRVNDAGRSQYARPTLHPLDPLLPLLQKHVVGGSVSGDDDRMLRDEILPPIAYLDLDKIARALRHPAGPLCAVPAVLQPLVNTFCRKGPAQRNKWNCTHLPCAIVQDDTVDNISCVVARSFPYQCHQHTSLAVLTRGRQLASISSLSVVFNGRFNVTEPAFFEELARLVPTPPRGHRVWLYEFSGESLVHYPYAADPTRLRWFNWTLGYDRTKFDEQTQRFLDGSLAQYTLSDDPTELMIQWRTRPHDILFLASNCNDLAGRLKFVKTFMSVVAVDSVGLCLHNRELDDVLTASERASAQDQRGLEQQLLLRKYKFVIAHENAIAHDYVTEKLWTALRAGTVPIYVGAPNVAEYLPHPNAALLASLTFNNTRAVAEYVRQLLVNPNQARPYVTWRTEPLSPWFVDAIKRRALTDVTPCTMCYHLHRFRRNRPLV